MKFTVDRSRWVHGGNRSTYTPTSILRVGAGNSNMLNDRGNMCCLGHCAKQLGWSDKQLRDRAFPEDVVVGEVFDIANIFVTLNAQNGIQDSVLTTCAASINDTANCSLKEREHRLKELFRRHGHTITFSGKPIVRRDWTSPQ